MMEHSANHHIIFAPMALLKACQVYILVLMALAIFNLVPLTTVSAFVPAANVQPHNQICQSIPKLKTVANTELKSSSSSNRPLRWRAVGTGTPVVAAMLPAVAAASESVSPDILQAAAATIDGGSYPATTGYLLPSLAPLLLSGVMDDMDPTKLGLFAFAGFGVAAAGFKTAVYWRMQFVVSGRCSRGGGTLVYWCL